VERNDGAGSVKKKKIFQKKILTSGVKNLAKLMVVIFIYDKSINSGKPVCPNETMPSEDLLFVLANEEKLEQEYSGKYIAISKNTVIAVGRSVAEVYKSVKGMNIANPLVTYVPKEGEEALLI